MSGQVDVLLPGRPGGGEGMSYVTSSGRSGSMHRTASQFTFSDVHGIGEIEREGQKSITRASAPGLKRLDFTQKIASSDYAQSLEDLVVTLTRPGAQGERIRFNGGSSFFENGTWWWIQRLDLKVLQRGQDNDVSRVELSWSLIELVVTPDVNSAIRRPEPTPPPATTSGQLVAPVERFYRVVPGDNLYNIARKLLGNGERWPEIYRMNSSIIGNPNNISPGMSFKIPK
jgi:nucleoid-associated protein YgaU